MVFQCPMASQMTHLSFSILEEDYVCQVIFPDFVLNVLGTRPEFIHEQLVYVELQNVT